LPQNFVECTESTLYFSSSLSPTHNSIMALFLDNGADTLTVETLPNTVERRTSLYITELL